MGGVLKRVRRSVRNASELARMGRLTEPEGAPFEVVHQGRVFKLRRYAGQSRARPIAAPILLVPPLMVTSEVYDIAEDISAVRALLRDGVDVWLCDFGAPEREEGGMDRTLDDHVRAVDEAIGRVSEATGQDVHLAGYSQGGMFAYQAAAYRRSKDLASVITFGSPVDIHRNVAGIEDSVVAQLAIALQRGIEKPLEGLEGLPGFLTSTGFKMLSIRKEVGQLVDFVSKLHDRQALEKRESRRRFLAGEGFVAWPGPALRTFIDEFIVHNRMLSGGFVVGGRTVTLADIHCPVLFFVGEKDDIARPASLRAVRRAVSSDEVFEVGIPAGHFGLVVGSKALALTWPTVSQWMRWREDGGHRPAVLREEEPSEEVEDLAFSDFDVKLFVDAAKDGVRKAFRSIGTLIEDAGDLAIDLKWQVPRLAELERLGPDSRVGFGAALAERAAENPDGTFFLWRGRAFSYGDAEGRVDAVVRGLWHLGVRPGNHVAVLMEARPSFLTAVTALNRMQAVAVLLRAGADIDEMRQAMALGGAKHLIADPDRAEEARAFHDVVWVLGGGATRDLEAGVVDMEAIDPEAVTLPDDFVPNAARARDLAMVLFTPSRDGSGALRSAQVTGRRWAFSALGAAAACTLTPDDTVYSSLPLHHAAGILVTVGGALVGGARLALADSASSGFPEELDGDVGPFWTEVRRYGVTVVFYAGEAVRSLVNAPFSPRDATHPIRLFAGSGMRREIWRAARDRFEAGVLEFYASTEVDAILANASGEKIGVVGSPLPGSAPIRLVAFDPRTRELVRDGGLVVVEDGVPGVLVAELRDEGELRIEAGRIEHDAFERGDRWFVSGDVLSRDEDGEHRFLGRLSEVFEVGGAPRSVREIEDALDTIEDVALPVVRLEGSRPVAYVALKEGRTLRDDAVRLALAELPAAMHPTIHLVALDAMPLTDGFRPIKSRLG